MALICKRGKSNTRIHQSWRHFISDATVDRIVNDEKVPITMFSSFLDYRFWQLSKQHVLFRANIPKV